MPLPHWFCCGYQNFSACDSPENGLAPIPQRHSCDAGAVHASAVEFSGSSVVLQQRATLATAHASISSSTVAPDSLPVPNAKPKSGLGTSRTIPSSSTGVTALVSTLEAADNATTQRANAAAATLLLQGSSHEARGLHASLASLHAAHMSTDELQCSISLAFSGLHAQGGLASSAYGSSVCGRSQGSTNNIQGAQMEPDSMAGLQGIVELGCAQPSDELTLAQGILLPVPSQGSATSAGPPSFPPSKTRAAVKAAFAPSAAQSFGARAPAAAGWCFSDLDAGCQGSLGSLSMGRPATLSASGNKDTPLTASSSMRASPSIRLTPLDSMELLKHIASHPVSCSELKSPSGGGGLEGAQRSSCGSILNALITTHGAFSALFATQLAVGAATSLGSVDPGNRVTRQGSLQLPGHSNAQSHTSMMSSGTGVGMDSNWRMSGMDFGEIMKMGNSQYRGWAAGGAGSGVAAAWGRPLGDNGLDAGGTAAGEGCSSYGRPLEGQMPAHLAMPPGWSAGIARDSYQRVVDSDKLGWTTSSSSTTPSRHLTPGPSISPFTFVNGSRSFNAARPSGLGPGQLPGSSDATPVTRRFASSFSAGSRAAAAQAHLHATPALSSSSVPAAGNRTSASARALTPHLSPSFGWSSMRRREAASWVASGSHGLSSSGAKPAGMGSGKPLPPHRHCSLNASSTTPSAATPIASPYDSGLLPTGRIRSASQLLRSLPLEPVPEQSTRGPPAARRRSVARSAGGAMPGSPLGPLWGSIHEETPLSAVALPAPPVAAPEAAAEPSACSPLSAWVHVRAKQPQAAAPPGQWDGMQSAVVLDAHSHAQPAADSAAIKPAAPVSSQQPAAAASLPAGYRQPHAAHMPGKGFLLEDQRWVPGVEALCAELSESTASQQDEACSSSQPPSFAPGDEQRLGVSLHDVPSVPDQPIRPWSGAREGGITSVSDGAAVEQAAGTSLHSSVHSYGPADLALGSRISPVTCHPNCQPLPPVRPASAAPAPASGSTPRRQAQLLERSVSAAAATLLEGRGSYRASMGRISASTLAPAYSAHADLLAAAGDGQWLGTIASSVLSELVDEVPGLEEQLAGVSGLQAAEASAVELVGGRPVGTGDFGKVYKGVWRGRTVAVKVMPVPTPAHLGQARGSTTSHITAASPGPLASRSHATSSLPSFGRHSSGYPPSFDAPPSVLSPSATAAGGGGGSSRTSAPAGTRSLQAVEQEAALGLCLRHPTLCATLSAFVVTQHGAAGSSSVSANACPRPMQLAPWAVGGRGMPGASSTSNLMLLQTLSGMGGPGDGLGTRGSSQGEMLGAMSPSTSRATRAHTAAPIMGSQNVQLPSGLGGSGWLRNPAGVTSEAYIVMEYCGGGSLRAALDHRKIAIHNPAEMLPLAYEVACAVEYLHANGVVHGDLKAANVMLAHGRASSSGTDPADSGDMRSSCQRLHAKVADFGHSRLLGGLPDDSSAAGYHSSEWYYQPQSFSGASHSQLLSGSVRAGTSTAGSSYWEQEGQRATPGPSRNQSLQDRSSPYKGATMPHAPFQHSKASVPDLVSSSGLHAQPHFSKHSSELPSGGTSSMDAWYARPSTTGNDSNSGCSTSTWHRGSSSTMLMDDLAGGARTDVQPPAVPAAAAGTEQHGPAIATAAAAGHAQHLLPRVTHPGSGHPAARPASSLHLLDPSSLGSLAGTSEALFGRMSCGTEGGSLGAATPRTAGGCGSLCSNPFSRSSAPHSGQYVTELTTPSHLAPEFFTAEMAEHSYASDVYALGVVLWELSTGRKPYHKLKQVDIMLQKQLPTQDVLLFDTETAVRLPPDYIPLCHDCWAPASQRPSASSIVARLECMATNVSPSVQLPKLPAATGVCQALGAGSPVPTPRATATTPRHTGAAMCPPPPLLQHDPHTRHTAHEPQDFLDGGADDGIDMSGAPPTGHLPGLHTANLSRTSLNGQRQGMLSAGGITLLAMPVSPTKSTPTWGRSVSGAAQPPAAARVETVASAHASTAPAPGFCAPAAAEPCEAPLAEALHLRLPPLKMPGGAGTPCPSFVTATGGAIQLPLQQGTDTSAAACLSASAAAAAAELLGREQQQTAQPAATQRMAHTSVGDSSPSPPTPTTCRLAVASHAAPVSAFIDHSVAPSRRGTASCGLGITVPEDDYSGTTGLDTPSGHSQEGTYPTISTSRFSPVAAAPYAESVAMPQRARSPMHLPTRSGLATPHRTLLHHASSTTCLSPFTATAATCATPHQRQLRHALSLSCAVNALGAATVPATPAAVAAAAAPAPLSHLRNARSFRLPRAASAASLKHLARHVLACSSPTVCFNGAHPTAMLETHTETGMDAASGSMGAAAPGELGGQVPGAPLLQARRHGHSHARLPDMQGHSAGSSTPRGLRSLAMAHQVSLVMACGLPFYVTFAPNTSEEEVQRVLTAATAAAATAE